MMKSSIRHGALKLACALVLATAPVVGGAPSVAEAQTIGFQTDESEIYVGKPFQLSIVLKDFDEDPQPEIDPFEIENADVSFMGVSPRVSSMTTIINGRRTSKRDVTFVFSYSITPKVQGDYILPQIRVTQGTKEKVSEQRVSFTAKDIAETPDMKLTVDMPKRALWVGETFDVFLNWYVRKDVGQQTFVVPFIDMNEYFELQEEDPAVLQNGRVLTINAGNRQIPFAYTRDNATLNGMSYTRFRIRMRLTPVKSGTIDIPAASVIAALESGTTQDIWGFGFPRQNYQYYKASDIARSLTIKELPLAQRPESFSNALGVSYEISVTPDRTIVQAGDPIILTIDISSDKMMEGLILPRLGKAGLNEALFNVSDESPLPETIDAGNGKIVKRFKVPVRVKTERVREVPPIAFSYFNPVTETYATVRSQPVALSVTAADKVSVDDVVLNAVEAGTKPSAPALKSGDGKKSAVPALVLTANSALQLGLETKPESLVSSFDGSSLRALQIGAYGAPFVLWAGLAAVRSSRRRFQKDKPQRDAVKNLRDALEGAKRADPQTAASQISNAFAAFALATETDKKPFQETLERLDAEAYRPGVKALPDEVVSDLRASVKKNVNPKYAKIVSSILGVLLAFGCCAFSPELSRAEDPAAVQAQSASEPSAPEERLARANQAYHEAMGLQEHKARLDKFAYASSLFKALSQAYPSNASLCFDWGNAAFYASNFGEASLAWRRAFLLDPTFSKARTNYAYLDSIQNVSEDKSSRTLSSFFFLNDKVSSDMRLLIAALCFFVAMMLCIPWKASCTRILRSIAVLPFIAWMWLLASVAMQPDHSKDAVVMLETALKNADNAGAANVLSDPVQPGVPVSVVETRGDWVMVSVTDGVQGWMNRSAIEYVEVK